MTEQEKLVALLKKKGIGPTMSKSLVESELEDLTLLFQSPNCELTTKAVMLTALLTLSASEIEKPFIDSLKNHPESFLPKELCPFIQFSDEHPTLLTYLNRVIKGENLSYDEFKEAAGLLFNSKIPAYLKASFLEAERLKRETQDENQACFDAFWERSHHEAVELPLLIDIANAYDGFNRHYCLAPFIACLLAAAGYPVILHGVDEVAPKKGVTAHKLLHAAGFDAFQSSSEAISSLKDPKIGWSYIDQSHSFPDLYALKDMRSDAVKRPILATIEKLLCPVLSTHRHILVTGYTHPPYKEKMLQLLQNSQVTDFVLFRGSEGSTQLPTDKRAPFVASINGHLTDGFCKPTEFDLPLSEKVEPDLSITVEETLALGLKALNGDENDLFHAILYNATALLATLGLQSPEEAKQTCLNLLKNGKAFSHWKQ